MTDSHGRSNGDLFAGTAWHYARYRPGYPQALFDDLARQFRLDGTGRLLDLGCGTGQLTLPLAEHVAEAIGMDPEPEMLAEAAGQAQATNITKRDLGTRQLDRPPRRSRALPAGHHGPLVSLDGPRTSPGSPDDMVDDDGGIVLANDSCLVRPTTAWQQAIEEIQRRFLPPDFVAPDPPPGRMRALST